MTPPWRYRLALHALSPLLLGYTAWRSLKDGGWTYWWQRLGLYWRTAEQRDAALTDETIWVHAASVGEVVTVLPLIKAWQAHSANTEFLVTTGTPTGAAVLQKQGLPGVRHQYLPIDFSGASRRFVSQLPVHRGWIVETEIWPWLYAQCENHDIELTIINGRLSDRTSSQSDGMMATSYRRALASVSVLARSPADASQFLALGAAATQVQVSGNLKYAHTDLTGDLPRPIERDYVLAASTHNDEEQQLARAWLEHSSDNQLLVIVPRHPERGSTLLRELGTLKAPLSLRSAGQQPQKDERIYLADTLGEMQAWYQHAEAAFVGGSLIERGGHNMLEPARHACPTAVGPHTANFDDIMQMMRASEAIHEIASADEAVHFLIKASAADAEYHAMARRALALAEDSRSVLQRYLQALSSPELAARIFK